MIPHIGRKNYLIVSLFKIMQKHLVYTTIIKLWYVATFFYTTFFLKFVIRLLADLAHDVAVLLCCLRLLQSTTSAKHKRSRTVWSFTTVFFLRITYVTFLRMENVHVNRKLRPVSLTWYSWICERGIDCTRPQICSNHPLKSAI